MSELVVDTDKLAYGLERGIGKTRTICASMPRQQRLRMAPCGLVSAAIHAYASHEDLPVRLAMSAPLLPFDSQMRHVVPMIGPEETDPTVIDASPSQFLAYAGITLEYERVTRQKVFPAEKVLSFTLSERHVVVDWLANAALRFQAVNRRPTGWRGMQLGNGPLADAGVTELQDAFGAIWAPRNLSEWTLPEQVREHGEVVSKFIPPGAIST
jgi:hypothetical protein